MLLATVARPLPAAPLGPADLAKLIELGIDDEAVVAKIHKDGINFAADEAALAQLKTAGASDTIVKALQAAAAKKAEPAAQAIRYQDVLQLVTLGLDEASILKRLQKSPTVFTLSTEQIAELKKAGATPKLIDALQAPRAIPAAAAEFITDFAIVLDCSGSMKEMTKEGEPKMTAAKRVVADLVQKIPAGINVALVLYGQEVFAPADDPRNCQAVKVARALAPLNAADKSELIQLIHQLKPTGATPISLALQKAGAELAKNDAFCGLVLVTDGMESCGGDPAAEAARLAANPKLSFGVNVVGFGVKPEDSESLAKVAKAGRGKYYDADSAKELTLSMAQVAQELESKAKPPTPVVTSRRAIKILKPEIEMPDCKEIQLEISDAASRQEIGKGAYGEEIRVPSATQKYQVVWVPVKGQPVKLLKDLVLPERKVLNIKPEEHLGMVRVNGQGRPKKEIKIWTSNGAITQTFQTSKQFGEIMVVPKGAYKVSIDDNLIEDGFEVSAGKLHELE